MKNRPAVASIILGILAFVPNPLSPLLAVGAIVLGLFGRLKRHNRILANIGIFLGVVFWILFALAVVTGIFQRFLRWLGF